MHLNLINLIFLNLNTFWQYSRYFSWLNVLGQSAKKKNK